MKSFLGTCLTLFTVASVFSDSLAAKIVWDGDQDVIRNYKVIAVDQGEGAGAYLYSRSTGSDYLSDLEYFVSIKGKELSLGVIRPDRAISKAGFLKDSSGHKAIYLLDNEQRVVIHGQQEVAWPQWQPLPYKGQPLFIIRQACTQMSRKI